MSLLSPINFEYDKYTFGHMSHIDNKYRIGKKGLNSVYHRAGLTSDEMFTLFNIQNSSINNQPVYDVNLFNSAVTKLNTKLSGHNVPISVKQSTRERLMKKLKERGTYKN